MVPAGSGLGGLITVGVVVGLLLYVLVRGMAGKGPSKDRPAPVPGALSDEELGKIAESEGPVDLPDGSRT
jgi:hypothetical protein